MEALQDALTNNLPAGQIISLVNSIRSITTRRLAAQDVFIYSLNTQNKILEKAIKKAHPDLLDDLDLLGDIWIYGLIYGRDDLVDLAEQVFEASGRSLPWGRLLEPAIVEDIDKYIQLSLLNGSFRVQEDLVPALVAAYRRGNQEMINYLGVAVGSLWDERVKKGYVNPTLRDATPSYRLLFQEDLTDRRGSAGFQQQIV